MLLFLALACTSPADEPSVSETPPVEPARDKDRPAHTKAGHHPVDQGQQHPPIPENDPIWEWDAQGFVGQPQWYGEHSWVDVRMRVAGHLAMAARDKARVQANGEDYAAAAETWKALHAEVSAMDIPDEGVAGQLRDVVVAHAKARGDLLEGMASEGPLPSQVPGSLSAARVAIYELARTQDPAAARAVQADLEALLAQDRSDLDIDGFKDFDARHQLRIRLYEAALDAGDPLGIEEPWGYWEASEVERQALVLGYVAGLLGGEDWSPRLAELDWESPHLDGDPRRWPSTVSNHLHSHNEGFTTDGLGWLPTGDSLIDVAGQPGPRAIGKLSKLGLDDEEHVGWLQAEADALNALMETAVHEVPDRSRKTTSTLDAHDHGSRFYNVKQARNETVRQLAREGHPDLALEVLADNYPLHNQDWACPNREGILQAIEGRLLAEADQRDRALATLDESMETSRAFLKLVDEAAAAPPGEGPGLSPPTVGGPSGGPPPGPPPRR